MLLVVARIIIVVYRAGGPCYRSQHFCTLSFTLLITGHEFTAFATGKECRKGRVFGPEIVLGLLCCGLLCFEGIIGCCYGSIGIAFRCAFSLCCHSCRLRLLFGLYCGCL